jgi:hypothetical protein
MPTSNSGKASDTDPNESEPQITTDPNESVAQVEALTSNSGTGGQDNTHTTSTGKLS